MFIAVSLLTAISMSMVSFFLVVLSKKHRIGDNEFRYGKPTLWVILIGAACFPVFGFLFHISQGGEGVNSLSLLIVSIIPFTIIFFIFIYLKSYRIVVKNESLEVKYLGFSKHYPYTSLGVLSLINDVRGGCTMTCRDKAGSTIFAVWTGFEGVASLSELLRVKAPIGFKYRQKDGLAKWVDDVKS
jgi:hypothetical protein